MDFHYFLSQSQIVVIVVEVEEDGNFLAQMICQKNSFAA